MREFFRGWRRKVGCVTLVMACVLMAGWVRSLQVIEAISLPGTLNKTTLLMSNPHVLTLIFGPEESPADTGYFWFESRDENPLDDFADAWSWRFCGFGVADVHTDGEFITVWMLPYWAFTIPLTLLSAYLIVWKPRQPPKPADP